MVSGGRRSLSGGRRGLGRGREGAMKFVFLGGNSSVLFGRELVSTPRIRVNEDLVGIGVGQALSIKSID